MAGRRSSDTIAVELRIRMELYGYLDREAKRRGHSPADEILRRLQSSRDDETRQAAQHKLTSTVQAADLALSEIEKFLTIVKPVPSPEIPTIDPAERPKK
jgi:negative regulator of replication initiation